MHGVEGSVVKDRIPQFLFDWVPDGEVLFEIPQHSEEVEVLLHFQGV
jgi:hypothetical protein